MTETRSAPVRRPRDRKQQIIAAAAELFRERGYHNTSLADVAAVVGITAPALYRHFRNKEDLLRYAVDHGLDDLDTDVTTSATLDEFIDRRVIVARERHALVALWQREARHLPQEQRAELRGRVRTIGDGLARLVRGARPTLSVDDAEFLTWALLSVFASFSNHRIALPRRDVEILLRRLSAVVVDFPIEPPEASRATGAAESAESAGSAGSTAAPNAVALPRREQLLASAIQLIDERGYQSVSMDDIGAAVGIAGPSIYKHYPAKSDLLVAALVRGHDQLQAGTTRALARAQDPAQALELLVRANVEFAQENHSLIGILISERDELPDSDRQRTYRAQRDMLETWVRVVDDASPGLKPAAARISINAVFSVINDLVRTRRIATRPDLADQLTALCLAILRDR